MQNKVDSSFVMDTLPLYGDSVLVRSFLANDLCDSYVAWLNNKDITRFSNQRFIKHDLTTVRKYFESFKNGPNLFLAVEDREARQLVGTMTVYIQSHHNTADVGILMGVQGHGYGKEAWNFVIDWLLNICQLRKVTAGTLSCNSAMVRLAELSGMHLEATKVAQEVVEKEPKDMLYFAIFHAD